MEANVNKRDLIENIINNNLYDDEIIVLLIENFQNNDRSISEMAMFGLINAPSQFKVEIAEKVTPFIKSESIAMRNMTSELLLKLGTLTIPYLLKEFDDESADVRKFACDLVGQIGGIYNLESVYFLLEDENENVVLSAIETLGLLEDHTSVENLIELFNTKEFTQDTIIDAFGKIGGEKVEQFLLYTFEHSEDELIRTLCIESLSRCGTSKELCDKLESLLYQIKDSLKGTVLKAYIAISQRNDFQINSSKQLKEIAYFVLYDDDDDIKLSALLALGNDYTKEDILKLTSLDYLTKLPMMIQIIYYNLLNYCDNELIELFFKNFLLRFISLDGIIDIVSYLSTIWDELLNEKKPFVIETILKELNELNNEVFYDVLDFFYSMDSNSTVSATESLKAKGLTFQR